MTGCGEPTILIISDDGARSGRLCALFSRRFRVQAARLHDRPDGRDAGMANMAGASMACVIDADLSDPRMVSHVRETMARALSGRKKYFIIDDNSRTDLIQANALGACGVLRENCIERDVALLVSKLSQSLLGDPWRDQPPATHLALNSINLLNENLFSAVATKSPLPKTQVADCCEYLIADLAAHAVGSWLDAVRRHHSYTYRHSMIVSGLAVSFALCLGMRRGDVERLAMGALLHDIGKMRMPLGLLDKPGELTMDERRRINEHPALGAGILEADAQFSPEVALIARHHHELLDGTGYPDRLKNAQIPDPVRIVTVVDMFAALIDQPAGKAAMPCERAYAILSGMKGKLDPDIVQAFRPIALNAGNAHEEARNTAA